MKTFWRHMAKLTVIGFAVVGVLCLLGVTSFWAGMAGLLVLDVAVLFKLNRPRRPIKVHRLDPLGPRHMYLN